jgi:dTDP-glucose pyrophosphorylase
MLGIIPAAGTGSRIQPLAFSKELLPVGVRSDAGVERPRAVSEYLVERLVLGGATRLCFVISPGKSDILGYFGGHSAGIPICYAVQETPGGLCDALFRALPFVQPGEGIVVGLPDTIWFPDTGLASLAEDALAFLLFPVTRPQLFDAVITDEHGAVREIEVKVPNPRSSWIWGAFKAPGATFRELYALWKQRHGADEYFGTLVNQFLSCGGRAVASKAGTSYVDVGTLHGYREAFALLQRQGFSEPPSISPDDKRFHGLQR